MIVPSKLETKRLILRPFNKNDFESFYDFMKNENNTKFLNFTADQKTSKGIKNLFNSVINSYHSLNPTFALVIADKQSGFYLGSCGFSPLEKKDEIECYYALLPQFWGNGYAIEAMKKMFYHAFSELAITKIKAFIIPGNTHGWKTAERVGMKYMGDVLLKNYSQRVMLFTIEKIEFNNQHLY